MFALCVWVGGVYSFAIAVGRNMPGFLLGAVIVVFPAAESHGRVLQLLTRRRQDLFLVTALSFLLGLIGVEMWSSSDVSGQQMVLVWLPAYQLCLFMVACYGFVRLMKRSPAPVVFGPGAGKPPDTAFLISVSMLEVLVPALLLANMQST